MSEQQKPLPEHFVPFEPANQLARKHGGFSLALLDEDVDALAAELRAGMAAYAHERFDYAIEAVAASGVLWRRRFNALAELGTGEASDRLEKDEGRLWKRWMDGLASLGLRPDTAAKMGLHAAMSDAARRRALLDPYRRDQAIDGEAVEDGQAA